MVTPDILSTCLSQFPKKATPRKYFIPQTSLQIGFFLFSPPALPDVMGVFSVISQLKKIKQSLQLWLKKWWTLEFSGFLVEQNLNLEAKVLV